MAKYNFGDGDRGSRKRSDDAGRHGFSHVSKDDTRGLGDVKGKLEEKRAEKEVDDTFQVEAATNESVLETPMEKEHSDEVFLNFVKEEEIVWDDQGVEGFWDDEFENERHEKCKKKLSLLNVLGIFIPGLSLGSAVVKGIKNDSNEGNAEYTPTEKTLVKFAFCAVIVVVFFWMLAPSDSWEQEVNYALPKEVYQQSMRKDEFRSSISTSEESDSDGYLEDVPEPDEQNEAIKRILRELDKQYPTE